VKLKERTPGERDAYFQGYRAGIEAAADSLNEHFGKSMLGDLLLNRVDKSIRALSQPAATGEGT